MCILVCRHHAAAHLRVGTAVELAHILDEYHLSVICEWFFGDQIEEVIQSSLTTHG